MQKRKKALFVTHDVSLYGASRSLQTLLANLEDTDIDIVAKKRLKGSRDLNIVNAFFNNKANLIKEFYLPHPNIYQGSEWKEYVVKLNDFFWRLNAKSFYNFIRKNNYDYIHLNSIVLHKLITEDLPFFIHIREIFNNSDPSVTDSLRKARGVFFIDEATEKPFNSVGLQNSTILNNAFDMRYLHELDDKDLERKYAVNSKTVFSIIGNIAPVKGIDLAIKSFKEVKDPDALLLIVGNSNNETYLKFCQELASDDKRVIFHGEESQIGRIYKISDYILRCDPQFCVGRTVYEGLYAGCNVILPGQENNIEDLFDIDAFSQHIFFYQPQSINSLTNLIETKCRKKVHSKAFSTNIVTHLQQFDQFITDRL